MGTEENVDNEVAVKQTDWKEVKKGLQCKVVCRAGTIDGDSLWSEDKKVDESASIEEPSSPLTTSNSFSMNMLNNAMTEISIMLTSFFDESDEATETIRKTEAMYSGGRPDKGEDVREYYISIIQQESNIKPEKTLKDLDIHGHEEKASVEVKEEQLTPEEEITPKEPSKPEEILTQEVPLTQEEVKETNKSESEGLIKHWFEGLFEEEDEHHDEETPLQSEFEAEDAEVEDKKEIPDEIVPAHHEHLEESIDIDTIFTDSEQIDKEVKEDVSEETVELETIFEDSEIADESTISEEIISTEEDVDESSEIDIDDEITQETVEDSIVFEEIEKSVEIDEMFEDSDIADAEKEEEVEEVVVIEEVEKVDEEQIEII